MVSTTMSNATVDDGEVDAFIEKLSVSTWKERSEHLELLRLKLARMTATDIRNGFNPHLISALCSVVSDAPDQQLDETKDLLRSICSAVPGSVLLRTNHRDILALLNKGPISLKDFWLHQLAVFITSDKSGAGSSFAAQEHPAILTELSSSASPLLIASVRLMGAKEISLSEGAKRFLEAVIRMPSGAAVFFGSEPVIAELRAHTTSSSSIIRFRAHELTVFAAGTSSECLGHCDRLGLLSALISELDTDDILGKLNALELLTTMAIESQDGLEYLQQKGLLKKLYQMLSSSKEDPEGGFLYPGIIKFFGHLSRLHPLACVQEYPQFLSSIIDLILNWNYLDMSMRVLAFDTLSILGSTGEGKSVLQKEGELMKRCMGCWGRALMDGPTDVRVSHLDALQRLLDFPEASLDDSSIALFPVMETWFSQLSPKSSELLFDLFKQPFPSIHCASGAVFKSLARYPWGQVRMSQLPGFIEYLLDRSTEKEMEGRYIKYEIVDVLVNSPSLSDSFDAPTVLRLREYQRQGVYYVKGQLEVATEES